MGPSPPPRPTPLSLSSLSSVLTGFTVFIKHQLTNLFFSSLPLLLLKFIAPYFLKPEACQQDLEGGGGGAEENTLGLLQCKVTLCFGPEEHLTPCVITEAGNIWGEELCLQFGRAGLLISLTG